MAGHEHTIKLGVKVDTSGLTDLETSIKKWDNHTLNIGVKVDETQLSNLDSLLKNYDDKSLNVKLDVTGNFETALKDIGGFLDSIDKKISPHVNIEGNAENEVRNLQDALNSLEKPITVNIDADSSNLDRMNDNLKTLAEGMSHSITEGLSTAFNMIENANFGRISKDIADGIARGMKDATSSVGQLQRELNSLKAPEITPKINMPDMGEYYGSYDDLGHLSLGAIGGSRLLSTIGVGTFGKVTWQNASQEQTNSILLPKFFSSKEDNERLTANTYEGGTNNIAHAASQKRTVRYGDLVSQGYGFTVATDAKADDLMKPLFGGSEDKYYGSGTGFDVIAAFGEHVQLLTGSEERARSAMYDLSKGFKGGFSSIDQYGISEETLKRYGFDPAKAKKGQETVGNYLRAVGQIIKADKPNELLTETTEGGLAQLRKRVNAAGKQIGQVFMEPVADLANFYTRIDKQSKGVLTKGIILTTGITSSIKPLQDTLKQLQTTFGQLTSGARAFRSSLVGLGDNLTRLLTDRSAGDSVLGVSGTGMQGILEELRMTRDGYQEEMVEGMFDFTSHDINQSDLTDKQKKKLNKQKKNAHQIYNLQNKDAEIERKARKTKGYASMSKKEQFELKDRLKRNELNKISKKGVGGKLRGILGGGTLKTQGGLVKDAFKTGGLKGGASQLTSSLTSMGSALLGVGSSIGIITAAVAGFALALAALGAILLVAWTYSETFRQKIATLSTKIHELFDMLAFAVGDFFQAIGLSKSGGLDGVIEVANNIVDLVTQGVDVLMQILGVLTGRDVKQDKGIQKTDQAVKEAHEAIEQERKENGGTVSHESFKTLANAVEQRAMWDETVAKDPGTYLNKMGITDKLEQEIVLEAMERQVTAAHEGKSWSYVNEELLPRMNEELGTELTFEDYYAGVNNEYDRKQFNKDYNGALLHQSGIPFFDQIFGDFFESPWAKSHDVKPTQGYLKKQEDIENAQITESRHNIEAKKKNPSIWDFTTMGVLGSLGDGYNVIKGDFKDYGKAMEKHHGAEAANKNYEERGLGAFLKRVQEPDWLKDIFGAKKLGDTVEKVDKPESGVSGTSSSPLTNVTGGVGKEDPRRQQEPGLLDSMTTGFTDLQTQATSFLTSFTANPSMQSFMFNLQTIQSIFTSLLTMDFATAWQYLQNFRIPYFDTLGGLISTIGSYMHQAFDFIIGNNIFQAAIGGMQTLLGLIAQACDAIAQLASAASSIPIIGGVASDVASGASSAAASARGASNALGSASGGSGTAAYHGGGAGGEVFNPSYGSSTSINTSNLSTPTVLQSNRSSTKTGGNTINNNLTITGTGDDEALAKKVVNVINNRFLWDAQKAGRTVDS